jgi:general secretion pathway protein G
MAARNTNLAELYDSWLDLIVRFGEGDIRSAAEEKLAEFNSKLGCSVMQDLLARVGSEYAVVLDIPPIDELMGSMAMGPEGTGRSLKNLGVLALIDGPETVDGCLRRLFANAKAETWEEDGLVRIELDAETEQPFSVYYGMQGDLFAMSPSPEFVRASLKPRPKGSRLTDGRDFAKVFKHLDPSAESLTYVNLPRARDRVQGSAILQAMIAAEPEASRAVAALMEPDLFGIGFGSTSVRTEEGTLTSNFGPSLMPGGAGSVSAGIIAAVAVPNLLNAIDRGKQKRTMVDIRSVGSAMEMYAVDNNHYPGPTDGLVPLEQLSEALSPAYIRKLPSVDGWGHRLLVRSNEEHYRIVSPGKDGILREGADETAHDPGPTTLFVSDIVFEDGVFVVWPEGTQE